MIGFSILFLWHINEHKWLSKKVNVWGVSVRFCKMLSCSLPCYVRRDHVSLFPRVATLRGLYFKQWCQLCGRCKRHLFKYHWNMSNLNWEQRINIKFWVKLVCYNGSIQCVNHYEILSFNFTAFEYIPHHIWGVYHIMDEIFCFIAVDVLSCFISHCATAVHAFFKYNLWSLSSCFNVDSLCCYMPCKFILWLKFRVLYALLSSNSVLFCVLFICLQGFD